MRTGLVFDARYEQHRTSSRHPERAERAKVVRGLLEKLTVQPDADRPLVRVDPRAATHDELARIHTADHIKHMASTAGVPLTVLDADTPVGAKSYETALLAAGGVLALVDAIMKGDIDNGFAAVRPPGHHAEREHAMGFCMFNNIAIAAAHLRAVHRLERVLIVDWDVHHGNGTQHSFESDPHVLFVSTHQWPLYPGSGAADETGKGDGVGYTLNIPLPAGTGDAELQRVFEETIVPAADAFAPQFVLVSAGFDAHEHDPLGSMKITTEGFGRLTRIVKAIAARHAGNRLACVMEGGYDLDGLRDSVAAVVDELRA